MTRKLTEVHSGDVFVNQGSTFVLFDVIIRETHFSMCYDRDYRAIPLTTILQYENKELAPNEFYKLMHIITIKGNDVPMVEVYNEPPFKFEPINLIKVSRKKKVESVHWI